MAHLYNSETKVTRVTREIIDDKILRFYLKDCYFHIPESVNLQIQLFNFFKNYYEIDDSKPYKYYYEKDDKLIGTNNEYIEIFNKKKLDILDIIYLLDSKKYKTYKDNGYLTFIKNNNTQSRISDVLNNRNIDLTKKGISLVKKEVIEYLNEEYKITVDFVLQVPINKSEDYFWSVISKYLNSVYNINISNYRTLMYIYININDKTHTEVTDKNISKLITNEQLVKYINSLPKDDAYLDYVAEKIEVEQKFNIGDKIQVDIIGRGTYTGKIIYKTSNYKNYLVKLKDFEGHNGNEYDYDFYFEKPNNDCYWINNGNLNNIKLIKEDILLEKQENEYNINDIVIVNLQNGNLPVYGKVVGIFKDKKYLLIKVNKYLKIDTNLQFLNNTSIKVQTNLLKGSINSLNNDGLVVAIEHVTLFKYKEKTENKKQIKSKINKLTLSSTGKDNEFLLDGDSNWVIDYDLQGNQILKRYKKL